MTVPKLDRRDLMAEMVGTTRSPGQLLHEWIREARLFSITDSGDSLHVITVHILDLVLRDDNGTIVIPGITNRTADRVLEPPVRPGGPPDKERASKPPLPSLRHERRKAGL